MEDLHEGMGKANFGPVDSAIAGCFDESKVVGILGIANDVVNAFLPQVRLREGLIECNGRQAYLKSIHGRAASGPSKAGVDYRLVVR